MPELVPGRHVSESASPAVRAARLGRAGVERWSQGTLQRSGHSALSRSSAWPIPLFGQHLCCGAALHEYKKSYCVTACHKGVAHWYTSTKPRGAIEALSEGMTAGRLPRSKPPSRGGGIEVRNFSQFSAISQFFAIFRNFSQFSAIFPQFFAIGFDPPRPQFPPPPLPPLLVPWNPPGRGRTGIDI